MTRVRVRRKPLLPFFVALAGLPLIAIAFDFATGARLLRQIGEVVYTSDVDPFELRDSFLASLFGFAGTVMVIWGLRELVFPQSVVKADEEALRVSVRGPFGRLTNIPWDELEEVAESTREVDGKVVPALALTVTRPGELPDHPWNSRWVGHTLVLDADHWDQPLDAVVNDIVRLRRAALTRVPPSITEPIATPSSPPPSESPIDPEPIIVVESADAEPPAAESPEPGIAPDVPTIEVTGAEQPTGERPPVSPSTAEPSGAEEPGASTTESIAPEEPLSDGEPT